MEKIYTFKLTQAEADLVVNSLGEQKYKVSAKLIANMHAQFQQQQQISTAENVVDSEVETEKIT